MTNYIWMASTGDGVENEDATQDWNKGDSQEVTGRQKDVIVVVGNCRPIGDRYKRRIVRIAKRRSGIGDEGKRAQVRV